MEYTPLTVTPEERRQARLLSEYKFEVDLQSRMITAFEEGIEIGLNRVLDLMRQGYSADEIERQLAGGSYDAGSVLNGALG